MKVLIADNNIEVANLVEIILAEKTPHSVIKVHRTEDAIEVAKDNPDIALVILDKDCLGEGSITSALRTLCDGVKIVLYSGGVVGNENPEELGVDAVIQKCGYPLDLLETAARLLAA